jgi:hypothetical protein
VKFPLSFVQQTGIRTLLDQNILETVLDLGKRFGFKQYVHLSQTQQVFFKLRIVYDLFEQFAIKGSIRVYQCRNYE